MSLRELCLQSQRFHEIDLAAFKKEIGAVEIHGMEDYFLTLLEKGIKVSNDCNSIIAYLIGITDDKPNGSLDYKGGTLPDVDMDFSDDRRSEVIAYVTRKYGADKVCGIGTYQINWARNSIKSAGRALGYEPGFVAEIAALVPPLEQGKNWHIEEALEISEPLKKLYEQNADVKKIIDASKPIDDLINSRGKHAAGIIIADRKIAETAPTFRDEDDFPVCEFVGGEVESLGLVKMDFLGIATLTVISDTLKMIEKRHKVKIMPDEIPLDDPKAFELMSSGNLMGIFQMQGDGLSAFAKSYAPKTLEDITAIIAIYRPGPMQFMGDILNIRNGKTWVDIQPHGEKYPLLKDILKETQLYFVYQEQIMRVVQLLAGYNDIEADEFRKIIGKKLRDKMVKEKTRFETKALEKGMCQKDIDDLWEQMVDFAKYSFNKSHALSYAIVATQTAWLKAHYPVEFFAANIKREIGDIAKVTAFVEEAKTCFGISLLSPDINESYAQFTVVNDSVIRFGLAGIVGVGATVVDPITAERDSNGRFQSITDFLWRIGFKSNVVINMIKAGCFDSFATRSQLLEPLPNGIPYIEELMKFVKEVKDKGWVPFETDKEWIPLPPVPSYSKDQIMEMENSVTNLSLSGTVFDIYKEQINSILKKTEKNKWVVVGVVSDLKEFKKKSGFSFQLQLKDGKVLKCLAFNASQTMTTALKTNPTNLFAVELKRFKDEENTMIANGVQPINKSQAEEYIIPITLDNDGLLALEQNEGLKERVVYTAQSRMLCLNFKGQSFSAMKPIGYIQ